MAQHNELGKWGECVAAQYLEQQGYLILERDWRDGHRDLDIVAADGGTLVIVEVKTRRNNVFAEPEEAVTWQKIRSLSLAANKYVKMNQVDADIRFDIVSVTGTTAEDCQINHIKDAFLPAL